MTREEKKAEINRLKKEYIKQIIIASELLSEIYKVSATPVFKEGGSYTGGIAIVGEPGEEIINITGGEAPYNPHALL